MGGMAVIGGRPATMRVASWANALALRALCGDLDRSEVVHLAGFASAELPIDHPLRVAVARFADRSVAARFDGVALGDLGGDLQRDILRAIRPAPVGAERLDLNG